MFPHRAQTIWHEGASRRSKSAARLDACIEFDQIQNELNTLISNAKNQTIEFYRANPGKYTIYKPTSMALEYIKKAQKLLSN